MQQAERGLHAIQQQVVIGEVCHVFLIVHADQVGFVCQEDITIQLWDVRRYHYGVGILDARLVGLQHGLVSVCVIQQEHILKI
jgi:hypothetical protein